MSQTNGLNRRAFLRNAGLTALAGAAAGTHAPLLAATADTAPATQATNGTFDFDTVYNRFGTDSTKFDQQINASTARTACRSGWASPTSTSRPRRRSPRRSTSASSTRTGAISTWSKWTPAHDRRGRRVEQAALRRDDRSEDDGARQWRAPGAHRRAQDLLAEGPKVLLQTPTYNGFYSDLTASETKAEESPLKFVNGKFQMDFDDFERRISLDTHTFILCNPQNPTGNCWSAEDLLRIGEICLKHRVVVLADEIHCDWVSKGRSTRRLRACRTRRSSTTASPSRRRASRSASRRTRSRGTTRPTPSCSRA